MDEEDTAGYREPCGQCAAVDWGISDEGRFFCKSCHNVIERTREVQDTSFILGASRVSTVGRGSRTKTSCIIWMVCEGFQFILKNQADALLRLGVSPHFKDDVLCQLWRLYLQRTQQAYTSNPVAGLKFAAEGMDTESDCDSGPGSSIMSGSTTDRESNPPSTIASTSDCGSEWNSSNTSLYRLSARQRRSRSMMTMAKTLALIHVALVWSREALTLSDLLRLVKEGHIPYVNAYEDLPEEMKLFGKDALLFNVLSIPSHHTVHREAQALVRFLQLPAFPPIGRQTLLHPVLLSLRFLTDANLPDELHRWVCRLMDRAGMADQTHFTVDPRSGVLPRYDVLTAALIIVTMKLIFGMDDYTEWNLSNQVGSQYHSDDQFNLRRWYRLMQAALIRAKQETDKDTARKQWRGKKPIFLSREEKGSVMKRKRTAEQVKMCFERVSSCPAGVHNIISPSSFRFCWGDKDGSDGPSLHHMKLDGVLTQKDGTMTPQNSSYWHPELKPCGTIRKCRSHYPEVEATLPSSFVWLLQLFSFILDVKPYYLYEEVLEVERRVFSTRNALHPRKKKKKRKTETKTRDSGRKERKSGGTGGKKLREIQKLDRELI